jgi:hypothetical protein
MYNHLLAQVSGVVVYLHDAVGDDGVVGHKAVVEAVSFWSYDVQRNTGVQNVSDVVLWQAEVNTVRNVFQVVPEEHNRVQLRDSLEHGDGVLHVIVPRVRHKDESKLIQPFIDDNWDTMELNRTRDEI